MRLKTIFEIADFQKHRKSPKNNNPKLTNLETAMNSIVTIETEHFS